MSINLNEFANSTSDEDDEYSKLPEAVRQFYTRDEYMWLSPSEKSKLVNDNTEPEWGE